MPCNDAYNTATIGEWFVIDQDCKVDSALEEPHGEEGSGEKLIPVERHLLQPVEGGEKSTH